MMADHPDIVLRLRDLAHQVDDVPVRDIVTALREAAETIETLRVLVGIREEIELEDMPPEGNA